MALEGTGRKTAFPRKLRDGPRVKGQAIVVPGLTNVGSPLPWKNLMYESLISQAVLLKESCKCTELFSKDASSHDR